MDWLAFRFFYKTFFKGGIDVNAIEELSKNCKPLENPYVTEWKAQGKKVMGYACTYLPEELLYAVDILPYRVTGRGITDSSKADSYLSRVNCSFARCCLEAALDSKFDFLDGAIFVNGCDHIRRCYENWEAHETAALPFMYIRRCLIAFRNPAMNGLKKKFPN